MGKAADPFMRGQAALADPGQLCGLCLWRGPGQQAAGGSAIGWAASSHSASRLWTLSSRRAEPTASSPSGVRPVSLPSHAQWAGTLSVQTPGPLAALTLGPQAEEEEIEVGPLGKKSKSRKLTGASRSQKAWV